MGSNADRLKEGGQSALPLYNWKMYFFAFALELGSNCTEAHVPTPRFGHYPTHAHNYVTRAVATMDSCFALVRAHQHGIEVGSMSGG